MVLDRVLLRHAELDPAKGTILAEVDCGEYIPERQWKEISDEIIYIYGLTELHLHLHYPLSEFQKMEPSELTHIFLEEDSMCRAVLAGCRYTWQGTNLHIDLKANGRQTIEKCIPGVCRKFREICGEDVTVTVESHKDLQGQELFDAMEQMRSDMMSKHPVAFHES